MAGWEDISTAPLGKMVWLWSPTWRHAFPGQRNGDNGAVYIDTCEPEANGWQGRATHWMPLPAVPDGYAELAAKEPPKKVVHLFPIPGGKVA